MENIFFNYSKCKMWKNYNLFYEQSTLQEKQMCILGNRSKSLSGHCSFFSTEEAEMFVSD